MFIAQIIRQRVDGWNTRILGETDALTFCRHHQIRILEDAKLRYGQIQFYRGHSFIFINPNLSPGMRSWVLWHEIAHFILHDPIVSTFSRQCRRKCDCEANYVAAIALMPISILEHVTFGELEECYGYPSELIRLRWDIYERRKLAELEAV